MGIKFNSNFLFIFVLLFLSSCSTLPSNALIENLEVQEISSERNPSSIAETCTELISKFINRNTQVSPDKTASFEMARGKKVNFVNATHLRLSPLEKKISRYPEDYNIDKDILIAFDYNGHAYLIVKGIEVHGHVLTTPIQPRAISRETHKAQMLLKISDLPPETINSLVHFIEDQEGKHSLTCLNFIEYTLLNGAGIKIVGRKNNGIHPPFEDILAEGFSDFNGKKIGSTLYKFDEESIPSFVEKFYSIRDIVYSGFPIAIKNWVDMVFNPDDYIVFNPSYRRNFKNYLENLKNNDYEKFVDLQLISSDQKQLRDPTTWEKLSYPAKVAWNWMHSTIHNLGGAYHVIKLIKFKPMKNKLIGLDHPWITGLIPGTSEKVYGKNIIFSSPRKNTSWMKEPEDDEAIVNKMGTFLGAMAKKSAVDTEIELGPKRRMPHVVNYLHGSIAYNGGTIIFNDIKDAIFHLSDPQFIKDLYHFTEVEKREFMVILRERDVNPEEYAFLLGFIRGHLKWYANANGPGQRILYGGPSAYPIINVINGNWVRDMYAIEKGDVESVVMEPIKNKYFNNVYQGSRENFGIAEKALIYFNYLLVKARGFQGGIVFTNRKLIEPEKALEYEKQIKDGLTPEMVYPISNPFKKEEILDGE
jgi:hypothetical protein